MNEEQKEFINKLLKDSNTNHGLIVNDIDMGKRAQITIKETNLKDLDYKTIVHDYISPSNSKTKNKVLDILLDIKENNDFTQYNNWVKENEKRGSFNKPHNPNYTNRLVDVVRWIINYNDLNKIMTGCIVSDKIVLKEKPLTTDDLKTTKNEDKSSTIDEEKSSKNDEKSFKPDEEILIENEEKSTEPEEEKSSKNEENLEELDDKKLINNEASATERQQAKPGPEGTSHGIKKNIYVRTNKGKTLYISNKKLNKIIENLKQ